MLILGIDPSLNATGWCVLRCIDRAFYFVDCGLIKFDVGGDLTDKIVEISNQFSTILNNHKISSAGMEETIVNANPSSSLKLGMVRGSVIAMCGAFGIKVREYAPKKIKMSIVGSGSANKNQVAFMVQKMISGFSLENDKLSYDITDAAATAITHYLYS